MRPREFKRYLLLFIGILALQFFIPCIAGAQSAPEKIVQGNAILTVPESKRLIGKAVADAHREKRSRERDGHHCQGDDERLRGRGDHGTAQALELEHLEYLEPQYRALDTELERWAQSPQFRTQIEALCTLRGVKTLTALTVLCEIDDIRRFASPRRLMAYFGLVPCERSSGDKEQRGPITKAGNIHVRRLLVEAAWNNHHRTGAELILSRRRQGQPPEVVAIALKAQHRLHKKFWRLDQRKHRHVAITAVARELCGFIWAILNALSTPCSIFLTCS